MQLRKEGKFRRCARVYLKSRKYRLFLQTQPDFVLAKDPLFSLLSDAPQELAQIEIGKGEPGIRGRAGGTKKRMAYLQQTRTPLERENGVPLAGVQSTKHTPAAANTANRLQGRGVPHRAAKKREPCAANLPSLPQGAHPAARPRRKQAHAKQIIAQKQENATKKANFSAKLRSVCAEDHKRAVKVYKRDRCQKENQE